VCRAVDYEQRATELGGVAHGHLKASKIQALARGVAMRTRCVCVVILYPISLLLSIYCPRYASIVRDWINGGGGDEQRRRRYIATEMSRLNEQFLTDSIADDSLDALLAASDDALALSHSVFRQDTEFDIEGPTAKTGSTVNMSLAGVRVEWFEVLSRARERSDQECAICMNDFSTVLPRCHHEEEEEEEEDCIVRMKKARVILSCSHVFHQSCLSAFERFNLASSQTLSSNRRPQGCVCPMCRASYEKRNLASFGYSFE